MTSVHIPRSFRDTLLAHLPYAESSNLTATDDLAALGLDSMGVIQLLADLEDSLGLEMPDDMLTEETFATAGSLWQTVSGLLGPAQSAHV